MRKRKFRIQVVDIDVEATDRYAAEELVNAALTALVKEYALENGSNVCECGRACGGAKRCDICT